jgi:hypothetical protein
MIKMGGSIQHVILESLSELEGKCGEEGYIKRGSIQLFNYSCGMIKGPNVMIQVVFNCEVSNPVPGQEFDCIVEHNTRAGIKARLSTRDDSPFIVFLARDHHYMIPQFSEIKEKEHIRVKVLGQRFEINDPKISVIATLIEVEKPEPEPISEQSESESDDDFEGGATDVLVLSDSTKKPGKGPDEQVSKKYKALTKHLDWRKRLSLSDVAVFSCEGEHGMFKGAKWKTLEHFKHACIVHKHDPVLALTFSMDGKHGDSTHLETKYKHIVTKPDTTLDDAMYIGLVAQFEQHPSKMQILMDTAPAKLMCPVHGHLTYYEKLRDKK